MANKVGKGFFAYLGIFLLIVLGIFVLLGAIMIIFPGVQIFGLSYYSYTQVDKLDKINNVELNINSLKEINFITEKSSVFIRQDTTAKPYLEYNKKVYGFTTNSDTKEYKLDYSYLDDVLTIKSVEPSGFLEFSNASIYTLHIPTTMNLSNAKINVKTKSGNVNIGGDYLEGLKDYKLSCKSLETTTDSGNIFISEHSNGNFETLNLISQKGKLTSRVDINSSNEIKLSSQSGKFSFCNISAPSVLLETYKSTIEAENLNANVRFKGTLGNVYLKDISGSFEATENVKNSNFTIENVGGQFLIPDAEASNIKLAKTSSNVNITSTGGSVTINDILSSVDLNVGSSRVILYVNAENTNDLNVTTTSGAIDVYYKNVKNESILKSNSGKIKIAFTNLANFKLSTHGKEGNVYYNWLIEPKVPAEYELIIGSNNSTTNLINATSNGRIDIDIKEAISID